MSVDAENELSEQPEESLFQSDLFNQIVYYAKKAGFLEGALRGLRHRVNDEIKTVIDDVLKQAEDK